MRSFQGVEGMRHEEFSRCGSGCGYVQQLMYCFNVFRSSMVCPFILSLSPPLQSFQEISSSSGKSSSKIKEGVIVRLLVGSKGNETGYIMRALQVRCHEEHYRLHYESTTGEVS